jgi:iron complex outermembrane recepter protein
MRRSVLARAVAGVFAFAGAAQAQQQMDAVVVTATPLGSELFDLVQPADVLEGDALVRRRTGSLGETLDGLPGVSSSYFGPAASRPVIRGMDADRIRVLQNGVGTHDASSLSFDHAVPYDPLAADRVEVVRGPAAVLYGGNAVGGVVNVIDNRIPANPIKGFTGRGELRYGGADTERSGAAVLEAGNGSFSLHADGFTRKTDELKIPGFQRSDRLRATDDPAMEQPQGKLPNSNARADGGSLGGSWNWGGGYAGLSYQGYNSNYGSIPEPDVRIDMKSERWDFAGGVGGLKFKLGRTDYEHKEIEAGEVGTVFKNKGNDGRLEYAHGKLGPFNGAIGVHFSDFDFSALGEEAFVPSTSTDAKGLFLYEELPLAQWKLSAGLRSERTKVKSEGGGPDDPNTGLPRFDPPQTRSFDTLSSAFGAAYSLSKTLALTGNLAFTERAPTFYELYANGAHVATGVYEVGNPANNKEKSRSFDLGVRWRQGPNSASISAYETRFDNFITLISSGNTRGADGELNPVDADGDGVADGSGEEILPESNFQAVPARFRGIEAQGRWRAYEGRGMLDVELKGDYVKAENRDTGEPLPRIAPARYGAALDYTLGRSNARVDVVHAVAQNRVGPNELPTDDYTLVNLFFGYRFTLQSAALQAFLRVSNLLDEEARNHTSFIKDIAPLGGRSVLVGLRGSF